MNTSTIAVQDGLNSHVGLITSFRSLSVPLLLVLFVWIVLIRLPFFTFDVLSVDEAVYLALGSGLRHGLIPYVDLVDRKPIGIFLIYAAAEALFKDPIIGVRVLGVLSTFTASLLLMQIGQRFMRLSANAAFLCGFFYSTYALLFYGDSGQTPVFYMPMVIAGGALVLHECERLTKGMAVSIPRLGWAGLALGLSLQVKYSTVFECVFFGCALLFLMWSGRARLGIRGLRIASAGIAAMVCGGLLPTVVAYAVYAALGYSDAFVFYNFTANLTREASDFPMRAIIFRSALFLVVLLPLLVMSVRYLMSRGAWPAQRGFEMPERWAPVTILLWFLSALFGALAQRQPYATYFFDTLAPLAILAAAAFHNRDLAGKPIGATLQRAAIVMVLPILGYVGLHLQKIADNGSPFLPTEIAQDLKAQGATSMFNFNYYGIVHYFAGIALPSSYPYPDHLLRDLEGRSFQFDGGKEIARILAGNPEVILLQEPISPKVTAERREMLQNKVADDYCLWRTYQAGPQHVDVYLNKGSGLPGAGRGCLAVARKPSNN